jgi:prepilin-type N-terminal cleavage/methylation domain-containing protein
MVHGLVTSRPRASAGFTLVELLIVIVVVSVVGVAFVAMFSEGIRTYEVVDAGSDMLRDGRYAEERIARELRRVRDGASITEATGTTFTFVDRGGATQSFSWSGVPGAALLHTRDGASRTLAAGVDSLAFGYWRDDGSAAAPVLAPSATDIRRVSVYIRLVRGTQKIETTGAAFLRSVL